MLTSTLLFGRGTRLAVLLTLTTAGWAADFIKRLFTIPPGAAESTLRQFSQQAGVQFIFDTDQVSGLRTAALQGEYFPREALDRMFTGTGWTAVQDPKTGALTLRKGTAEKNVPGAAPVADRPNGPLSSKTSATGTVEGQVLNWTTGNFLNAARISVAGTNIETYAGENGEYRLPALPAGDVKITASYSGLTSQTEAVTISPKTTTRRDFALAIRGAKVDAESGIVRLEAMTVQEREMSGQAVALHERRNAPNIKNVIAIDVDVGEGNVGEFLKYVPGIGIEQNPQDPQFVSIRGMPAAGTLVTTNGMEMASNSFTSGRETDFAVAASGNIDRIEVSKVPTPDMPANAVGGMINLITKNGFSRRKPIFSYNAYGTFTTLDGLHGPWDIFTKSGGPDSGSNRHRIGPSLNLSYVGPVSDKVAVALAFSKSNRYSDLDYRRPIWNKVTLQLTSNSMNALVFDNSKLLGAATIDWKVLPDHVISFGASHSLASSNVRQNQVTSTFGAGAVGGPTSVQGAATGVGTVVMDPIWNNQSKTMDLFTINHRFTGARWKAEGSLSYSKLSTTFTDVSDGFFTRAASTSITNLILGNNRIEAVTDRLTPIVTATSRTGAPVDIHDARNYTLTSVSSAEQDLHNQGRRAAINVSRELDLPFALTLKAGALFNHTRNETVAGGKTWTFTPPGGAAARLIGNFNFVADAFSARNHFKDTAGNDVPVSWLSLAKIKDVYDEHPQWFVFNESGAYIAAVNATKTIQETITAGYMRADFKFLENRLWVVGGVRFERTADEGWGPRNDIGDTFQRGANGNFLRNAAGALVRVTTDVLATAKLQYTLLGTHVKKHYDGYYPSVNTSFWVTPTFVARAAYARTLGRPNYTEILPGVTAANPDAPEGSRVVTVINSGLKPWTANNYDLSFELYELKGAIASVNLFQKDITNFFAASRVDATPETLAEFNLPDDYLDYEIVSKRNAGSATITGIEVGYRQSLEALGPWGRGLMVFSNLTNMHLSGPDSDNFTNFNARSVQQGVSFARRKFSARVSYNYTWYRRRLPAAAGATVRPNSYNTYAPQTKVDVSVAYMLNKRSTLYADVRNLNAMPQRSGTWSPDGPEYARIDQFQFVGASFTVGVRGDF